MAFRELVRLKEWGVGIIIDKLGMLTMRVAKPPGEFFSIVIFYLQQNMLRILQQEHVQNLVVNQISRCSR